jgi:D-alanyl-D-alanine carboxypeptidase (penicillin-binding protein 5/6)
VQSGNDACVVLAEGVSGSHESFADEMNRVAARIGLKNSHFKNADGLPDPQHRMTARDLAVLAVRIIEDFPEHYPRFSQSDFTYHGIRQANRNPLLGDKELGVDGMKTGHTEDGGYGIVISAKQAERRLVLVVNGLTSTKERASEAERLLRYGFREFEVKTPFKQGDKLADVPVWMGGSLSVPAVVGHDVAVTLPRHRQGEVKLSLEYHAPLAAPVAKGQEIGRLLIQFPNADPQIVPVQAGEDVPELSGFGRIWPALKYYIFIRD